MKEQVVFFGYGKLGALCLEKLLQEGYEILFVYTHAGGKVEQICEAHMIPFSYQDLRKQSRLPAFFEHVKRGYLVSVNYRYILEERVFASFLYALNLHGSLLPRYRGRTPHVWSVINGEKEVGVTCHLIDKGVDTGDIVRQVRVPIELQDTGYTLLQKYEEVYPKLLIDALQLLKKGYVPLKQDERIATYFGKRTPDMGYLNLYAPAEVILNFIRAQAYPYPGAYTYTSKGEKVIVNNVKEVQGLDFPVGTIHYYDAHYYFHTVDGKTYCVVG